jgi:hypothetical protein
MSHRIADQSGDVARGVKDPSLGWMIAFLFVVSFLGLFSVVPLRKVLILPLLLLWKHQRDFEQLMQSYSYQFVFADNDNRLQTTIPKWHCNCSSYQQLSYSSRGKASQETSPSLGEILLLQLLLGFLPMVLYCR